MESREAHDFAEGVIKSAFRDIENAGIRVRSIRPSLIDITGCPTNADFTVHVDCVEMVIRGVLISRGPS